jgi:hypothetical protein
MNHAEVNGKELSYYFKQVEALCCGILTCKSEEFDSDAPNLSEF